MRGSAWMDLFSLAARGYYMADLNTNLEQLGLGTAGENMDQTPMDVALNTPKESGQKETEGPGNGTPVKKSGAQRRREAWARFNVEKRKAEAEGKPLPTPPSRRKNGAQRKREKKAEAGAGTRPAETPTTSACPGEVVAATAEVRKGAVGPKGPAAATQPSEGYPLKRKPQKSVSDPGAGRQNKKARRETETAGRRPAFSAVASGLPRVMVTVGEELRQRMEMVVFDELRSVVMDQILEIPEGEPVPRFRDTVLKSGMAVFYCQDADSEKWLRGVVPSLKLRDGSMARLVLPSELVKRVKMTVLVPPPKKETDKLLKLLGRQNTGLDTASWVVHGSEEVGVSTLLILGVDEKSAAVLMAKGGRAFLGTNEVQFRTSKHPGNPGEKQAAKKD